MISVLLRIQRSVSGPQHKKNTFPVHSTRKILKIKIKQKRNKTKQNITKRNETKRKKNASNLTLYLVRLRVEVNARESVAALVML